MSPEALKQEIKKGRITSREEAIEALRTLPEATTKDTREGVERVILAYLTPAMGRHSVGPGKMTYDGVTIRAQHKDKTLWIESKPFQVVSALHHDKVCRLPNNWKLRERGVLWISLDGAMKILAEEKTPRTTAFLSWILDEGCAPVIWQEATRPRPTLKQMTLQFEKPPPSLEEIQVSLIRNTKDIALNTKDMQSLFHKLFELEQAVTKLQSATSAEKPEGNKNTLKGKCGFPHPDSVVDESTKYIQDLVRDLVQSLPSSRAEYGYGRNYLNLYARFKECTGISLGSLRGRHKQGSILSNLEMLETEAWYKRAFYRGYRGSISLYALAYFELL